MIERVLRKAERESIRKYAKQSWDNRARTGKMDARKASMVQQDVARWIKSRKQRTQGIFATIFMHIAIKFAMALITKWLQEAVGDERKR
ncbi:MAG: hypothetical protein ACO23H_03070 [Alphaproteobacteria bacterium]